jgi:hypothetical protein
MKTYAQTLQHRKGKKLTRKQRPIGRVRVKMLAQPKVDYSTLKNKWFGRFWSREAKAKIRELKRAVRARQEIKFYGA